MPGMAPVHDQYWFAYIIPLGLGVMLLWRLSPRGSWIGLWPLAFTIGATAGLRLVAYFQADFLSQIRSSVISVPFFKDSQSPIDWERTIENVVLLTGTLACLSYFFFSFEHKGALGRVSKVGVWVLMITFGAGFGYTVMGRIALLAIRLEFLFDDWLWLIDPLDKRIGM
jgi:hypothetical protein